MIWLQTFGGAVVYALDGQPMLGAATQRRTLGLLAILAVAGESGISRDKLVGLLWPESTPRRARHSLTQALYAARKALGCEDLVEGIEDVRLNPLRVRTDVTAFRRALESGDQVVAAALYRGTFLDGLYLSTTEFERWLDGCRASFEEQAVAALKTLVADAEAVADYAGAADYLRQLASVRPADSAVALQLMRVLSQSGNPAAAIQRADLHAKILRDDFQLAPDRRVIEFAEELRRSTTPLSATSELGNEVWHARALEVAAESHNTPIEATAVLYQRGDGLAAGWSRAEPGRKVTPWRALSVAAVFCVLIAAIYLINRARHPTTIVEPLQQRIVVAPFRIGGADASLHFLREGMVELLSTRLAEDTTARAVDAGAVLRAWRRAGINRSQDASNDTVVRLAARLGAERVIVGSVVGTSSRAVLSAAVIAAQSGEISGEATVEGPADSLTVLVDRLAGLLLASEAGPDQPLSALTTTSLPALRAFVSASSAFADGDYRGAADRYDRALRFDPAFALAAFRLGLTARRMADFALERKALEQAWQFQETLSEQDRTHLTAWAGPQYPDASRRQALLAAWEAAARVAPDRADVWLDYAATLANRGQSLAALDRERVVDALERAIELDPAYVTPRLMLLRLTGRMVPEQRADSFLNVQPPVTAPVLLWRFAHTNGDSSAVAEIVDTLPRLGPANLRMLVAAAQFEGLPADEGLSALRVLRGRAQSAEQATDFLLAEHSFELNRGRPAAAVTISRRMQRLSPATRSHLRLRVLDAVFAEGDTAVALQAAAELERTLESRTSRSVAADACALAQWASAHRDTATARRALHIMRATDGAEQITLSVSTPVCARLTEAAIAVETGAADAKRRVLQLDSLVLTTTAVGDIATFAHLAIARFHRRLGQPELALQAIRRRPYMTAAWPRYLAATLREEGELSALVGDQAGAMSAYEAYLSLRGNPDPAVMSQVAAVRAAVHALRAQTPR